ncbi:MAG: hypothetical protein Q4G53_08895 [Clostridia bacterium]|nr:hypothetical protein [Clostridia bacterium]
MLINVIKIAGDSSKPNMVEMDTAFNIGDKFKMEYDWCRRKQAMNGYTAEWHKDIAVFEVVDIVCNMLVKPYSVWLRLRSWDENFTKRCGCEEFDVPEYQVLERKSSNERKDKDV